MRERLKSPTRGSGLKKTRRWADKKIEIETSHGIRVRGKKSVRKFKERETAFRGFDGVI